MAVKFQYNKTSLTEIGKALSMRLRALPTLKSKESALRLSAMAAKAESERLERELSAALDKYDSISALWNEFDASLVRIKDITLTQGKVAGIKTPELGNIEYEIGEFDAFISPAWYPDGVEILKTLSRLGLESEICARKSRLLDYHRRKTTQKVNLYEKVQIPGYQEAILKIKRYMEDADNISKASSKIVKSRHALLAAETENDTL